MERTLLGATLLYLMVSLAGCATPPPEVIRVPFETTVIEKVTVPEELLRQCRSPDLDSVRTNGDIESVAIEAVAALEVCNQDKVDIKEWTEDQL